MEAGKDRKRPKFSVTQGNIVLTSNRKENGIKKAPGPGNKDPPQRLADQIDGGATSRDGRVLDTEISSYDTAEQDTLDYLESRAVELSEETSLLSRELRRLAAKCMDLTDANAILMDELRQMCGSSEMEILEGTNPDNNPHRDEECSSHSTILTRSESSSE